MKIIFNEENLTHAAGSKLDHILKEAFQLPVLLMLSGGSALRVVDYVSESSLNNNITITTLDERYTNDPQKRNFEALGRTKFFKRAHQKGCAFVNSRPCKGESLRESAYRFEKSIQNWKEKNQDGKVIITQGIGADGHTAGILPFSEDPETFRSLFENNDHWVVGYRILPQKNEHTERITVTIPFLVEIVTISIVYVSGDSKKEAFARVFVKEGSLVETPARVIHKMKNVFVFTDIQ